MLCRNCFREIPDNSKFCRECGAKLGENGEVLESASNQAMTLNTSQDKTDNISNNKKSSNFMDSLINLWNNQRWLLVSIVAVISVLIFMVIGVSWYKRITDDRIKMPASSSELMSKNYQDAITTLESAGFSNIRTEVIDDLILGWLTKDGEIERISVAGETSFSAGDKYEKDALIIVAYHTFPEDRKRNREETDKSDTVDEDKYVQPDDGDEEAAYEEDKDDVDDKSVDDAYTESEEDVSADSDLAYSDEPSEDTKEEVVNTLNSYIGRTVEEVKPVIAGLGYSATYIAYNTGSDFTWDMNNVEKGDDGYMGDIFKVKEIRNVDSNEKCVEIGITTDEIENYKEQKKSNYDELNAKLDVMNAWVAAEHYGKQQYNPYKFKLKYLSGKLAEEAQDSDTWFLKAYCEINGVEYNCESKVTGTSDNPVVTYFQVY